MITSEDIKTMRACAMRGKPYRADVEITVGDIEALAAEHRSLDDTLSLLATGSENMTDLNYRVVDFKGDDDSTLIVSVSGRVDQVVAEIADAQTQDA